MKAPKPLLGIDLGNSEVCSAALKDAPKTPTSRRVTPLRFAQPPVAHELTYGTFHTKFATDTTQVFLLETFCTKHKTILSI